MRNLSSTFSSRVSGSAAFTVCLAIVLVELFLSVYMPPRFFSHDVDMIAHGVQAKEFNSDTVLIGDSVARQVFTRWKGGEDSFAMLATNQAIEMPGQYYLLERYVKKNRIKPRVVILMGRNPFGHNLNQGLTENYVQRTFTSWREMFELTRATGSPVFGLKILLYKVLPSYKYRLHIQKEMVGFTNADVFGGGNYLVQGVSRSLFGLFEGLRLLREENRRKPISDEYFERMARFLSDRDIAFRFLFAPMPESEHRRLREGDLESIRKELGVLEDRYDNFIFIDSEEMVYPDGRFPDGIHLDGEGLEEAEAAVDKILAGHP